MATKRKADVEDLVLKKSLQVTLVPAGGGGNNVYLEQLAAELLSEGKNLALERDVLERVLMDRLSTYRAGPGAETPFIYLVGCYRRVSDEMRKLRSMKDRQMLAEVLDTLTQVKELSVSYAGNICLYPDMFPQPPRGPNDRRSDLLGLILADLAPSVGFNAGTSGGGSSGQSLPAGFLDHFVKRFEDEGLSEIFNPVFLDLRQSVMKVSALGPFQGPLRALALLVQYPPVAKALVTHPSWNPKEGKVNGRTLELHSILGAFFHISAIPDHPVFSYGEPTVGQQCFSDALNRRSADVMSAFATIKTVMNQLYEGMHEVLGKLLRAGTREYMLDYLADLIDRNAKREAIQANPFMNASSGMFVCLSAVMMMLCQPFLDPSSPKKDKIDVGYVLHKSRVDFSALTALHASTEEVATWVDKRNLSRIEGFRQAQQQNEQEELRRLQSQEATTSSNGFTTSSPVVTRASPEQTSYHFICECFFLTARVLNLGLLKALSDFKALVQELSRQKELVSNLNSLRGAGAPPELENDITQATAGVERLSQDRLCYEAQLMKDVNLMQNALSYYRLMVCWLVSLIGGFKMPLPVPCPMEFASMPEHFTEDSLEVLLFAARVPRALDGIVLDDFMSFIVMFMGSPLHVKNPYVRAKMVEVLSSWLPSKCDTPALKNSMTSLFEGHQLALQYLVPNLLKLYVDIEFTGSHNQFYDKFNIRHNIAELLEFLWDVPSHHHCWKQIAMVEERGAYLKFLNLLINDSIFLLDESLKKIPELKAMEEEMANPAVWDSKTPQERQERTRVYSQHENVVRIDMTLAKEDVKMLQYTSSEITAPFLLPEMVERIAYMLNYFLMQLTERNLRKTFKLKNPEKYEFNPRELLGQIVDIYVHLARGDTQGVFSRAISSDGRSYREENFTEAARIVLNNPHDEHVIKEFLALGQMSRTAASEAMDTEALLGDIPEEFLDPIQYTLMTDPVILPSSKTTLDRSTIQRHLLSDQTDPFNRSLLTSDMLIPDTELKARIEEFLWSHKQ